jgi:hypothetical protein
MVRKEAPHKDGSVDGLYPLHLTPSRRRFNISLVYGINVVKWIGLTFIGG